jgi:hypothetical protein
MKEAFTIPSISPDMNYAGEDCPATGNGFQLSCPRGADEKFAALIIVCDLAKTRRRIWVPIYTESPQGRVETGASPIKQNSRKHGLAAACAGGRNRIRELKGWK